MNGQEAFEQLCNVLLEAVGRTVAPLGVDKAVKRLQQGMAHSVTDGDMTTQAASFVAQISPRQLYVHKKGEEPTYSRSLVLSLYELLSSEDFVPFESLFNSVARTHHQLSWSDLRHILVFFVQRGWFERAPDGQDAYRLRSTFRATCEGVPERVGRLQAAIPAIMKSLDGFLLERPHEHIKLLTFSGSPEAFDKLLEELADWLFQYCQAHQSDGNIYQLVIASSCFEEAAR
ncbi:MAG: hypothetical protein ACKO6N_18755 [Myxococcota bacterium]